mmetsp:Transcript_74754/g.209768  ORF Transcript_74754/g.209768 Transcript_74754/m.209768 type:complete len:279 (+) Transcript_74754:638-1474(+)
MQRGAGGGHAEAGDGGHVRSHRRGCAHHRGGRRDSRRAAHGRRCGGGVWVEGHRGERECGRLFGTSSRNRRGGGLPMRLCLPRSRDQGLLLLLHHPHGLLHAHFLLLACSLLHRRNLVLTAVPDLALGAQVAVTALRTILAAPRLVEPGAGAALPGAMEVRARGGQAARLPVPRGQRQHDLRGLALVLGPGALLVVIVLVLLVDVLDRGVRRRGSHRGGADLAAELDFALGAHVAVPALNAVLAALRLVVPSAWPALTGAVKCGPLRRRGRAAKLRRG